MIDPAHIATILHNHPNQVRDIPLIPSGKDFHHHVTENSLDRTPIAIGNTPEELHREWKAKMKGVSMKKAHEITRLASYIHSLPSHIPHDYIVDVGSGQGYLHRVLPAKHILALDSDQHQITGAESREKKVETKSTELGAKVTHKTLDITPESLVSAIDDWISSIVPAGANENRISVLIVALHACGSLHIDALQTFIHASKEQQARRWYFSSAVTVPCCYNLLRPNDFPLSPDGPKLLKDAGLPHPLPASAYHLAAQGELEERNKQKWELGIRKVVWRALVGPILEDTFTSGTSCPPIALGTKEFIAPSEFTASKNATAPTPRRNLRTIAAPTFASVDSSDPISKDGAQGNDTSGTGTSVLFQRLGKLPNTAYESWEIFMQHVERRLYSASTTPALTATGERSDSNSVIPPQINLPRTHPLYADAPSEPPSSSRAEQLEQLHIARCSLGPVIESVILKDRKEWAQQQLLNCQAKWEVQLVPLFDQKKGSARNMAVVVIPEAKSPG